MDVGQNGRPRGPQMWMSSLVLTIQLSGYLILTHTHIMAMMWEGNLPWTLSGMLQVFFHRTPWASAGQPPMDGVQCWAHRGLDDFLRFRSDMSWNTFTSGGFLKQGYHLIFPQFSSIDRIFHQKNHPFYGFLWGFSTINHPFYGDPHLWKPPILMLSIWPN